MKNLFKIGLIVLLALFSLGCSAKSLMGFRVEVNPANAERLIPANAQVITNHGNGWIEFELEGNRYLFRHLKSGFHGYETLTQIK